MSVMNYKKAIVYEIYTNQGFFYISHDKDTNKVEVHGIPSCSQMVEIPDQKTTPQFPFLK